LKGRTPRLYENARLLDRAIDQGVGKFNGNARWSRGQRVSDRGGGHTDRAEIVGSVGGMVSPLIATARRRCRYQRGKPALRTRPVQRMDVTEGHAKVDRNRDEREP
jgi:hypothetical protein